MPRSPSVTASGRETASPCISGVSVSIRGTILSAGQPDWNKLAAMGKLPKEACNKIPLLSQLDAANERIKVLEEENARLKAGGGVDLKEPPATGDDHRTTQFKCEQCGAMVGGMNETIAKRNLEKHMVKLHSEPKV